MQNVGRNDTCPCGSGKKYKKCCENNVVQLGSINGDEVILAQRNILEYSLKFEQTLSGYMVKRMRNIRLPDSLEEMFSIQTHVWTIFTFNHMPKQTIVQKYIQEQTASIKNSRLRSVVKSWDKWQLRIFEKLEVKGGRVKARDHFTKEDFNLQVFEGAELFSERDYRYYFGFVLPFENEHTLFGVPLPLYEQNINETEERWQTLKDIVGEKEDERILRDYFPEFMDLFFLQTFGSLQEEEIEWEKPEYEEVAQLIEHNTQEDSEAYGLDFASIIIPYWEIYVEKVKPIIRKPILYAAAIEYVCYDILFDANDYEDFTYYYDITEKSLKAKVKNMREVLQEELYEFEEAVKEQRDEMFSKNKPVPDAPERKIEVIDFQDFKAKKK